MTSKITLSKFDLATRYGVQSSTKFYKNDEIDCTQSQLFGGSGLHQLLLQNPTVHLLVTDWQAEDLQFVFEYMRETGQGDCSQITYDIVKGGNDDSE